MTTAIATSNKTKSDLEMHNASTGNVRPLHPDAIKKAAAEASDHLAHVLPEDQWDGLWLHVMDHPKTLPGGFSDIHWGVCATLQRRGGYWFLVRVTRTRLYAGKPNYQIVGLEKKVAEILKHASKPTAH